MPMLGRLILFLLMLCLPAAVWGDSPVAINVGTAAPNARYDFGEIRQGGAAPLTHTFLLRNDGPAPVTIGRFQPSCHCTSAAFMPQQPLPVTLAPGAQAAVQVSVVIEPYLSGPLEKYVQVFATGQDEPLATLTLDGNLHPLAVMDPLSLDFGTVSAGQARSLTLTATVDARLVPKGKIPALAASDPDIQITPLRPRPDTDVTTRTFAYRVTLSSRAALGPVQDLLQFIVPANAPSVSGMTLADGPGVPVAGTVRGPVLFSPAMLAFGVVSQGQSALLPVRLTAKQDSLLAAARASTRSPYLRLSWVRRAARTRTLDVMLDSGAPVGAVQSQVTILLRDGLHLRLPVTAYIAAR